MEKDVVTKEEFTQLLYEVTDAYENKIKILNEELIEFSRYYQLIVKYRQWREKIKGLFM